MSKPEIRAVFFDLDDTLCGYWEASKRALRETFEIHDFNGHGPDRLLAEWASAFREFLPEINSEHWYPKYLASGAPTRTEQMRRTLLRLENRDPELAELLSATYLELRNRYLELFPEAIPLLKALRGDYPLGLITNGPADIQRMEIDRLGIDEYFDHIFIEGEQGIGKPDAEIFRRAAEAVGFQSEELLFVGNSYLHDILPAIDSGWKTAWIRRTSDLPPSGAGTVSTPEEIPAGKPAPNLTIGNLTEILSIKTKFQ